MSIVKDYKHVIMNFLEIKQVIFYNRSYQDNEDMIHFFNLHLEIIQQARDTH